MATPMDQTEEHSPSMELTAEQTAEDHIDINAGHLSDITFPPTKEQHPGEPLIPHLITDIANISEGDHVLYQIWGTQYRKGFQSGLVSEVQSEQGKVKIITFTNEGVNEESLDFSSLTCLHQVEYSLCRFSTQEAIARARHRRDMNEMLYNPLNNNGHHFVTNAKTGREYPLSDMILDMETPGSGHDCPLTPVAFERKLHKITDVKPGQHLLLKKRNQHLLVQSCNHKKNRFTAIREVEEVVDRITVNMFPSENTDVFEITYEKQLCPIVSEDVVLQRAKEALQSRTSEHDTNDEHDTNTSVSQTHTVFLETLDDECPVSGNDVAKEQEEPVRSKQHNRGTTVHSSQKLKTHDEDNHADALSHEVPIPKVRENVEQDVSQHTGRVFTSNPGENPCSKTNHRHISHFVTQMKMKTGRPLTIDECCLFDHDVAPESYTLVTAHVALDEGDHIAVKTGESQFSYGIVLRNMGTKGLLTAPNLNGDSTIPTGLICLNVGNSEVFRVNYKQSVSADQTKKRACSGLGKQILSEKGAECFTTWAKTGNPQPVNLSQLMSERKKRLKHVRPLYRERITSYDDIKVGDHLIQGYPTHWFHFLVSGKIPSDSKKIKCIYCYRAKVSEKEITLDLHKEDVYRIQYFESFAPEEAIRRAREEVGKMKFGLLARMWFVRWAKTGSNEGIEVDFLENRSMPISKSQLSSFAQLNIGDAIVKKEKLSFSRYYIVTEVCSPFQCVAIESYNGLATVTLQLTLKDKDKFFYRLNYLPGACFLPEDSANMAKALAETHSRGKHLKSFLLRHPTASKKHFINYVKTGDSNAVDADALMNDRPLSVRTKNVFSTRELLPGDHIMCRITEKTGSLLKKVKAGEDSEPFHHMMVAETPREDGICCVFHFSRENENSKSKGKPKILRSSKCLFKDGGEVHRICYSERTDPHISLKFLAKVSKCEEEDDESCHSMPIDGFKMQALKCEFEEHRMGEYNLLTNNCEHLITFAIVRVSTSLQIIETLYQYLEYHSDIPLDYVQAACSQLIRGAAKGGVSEMVTKSVTTACHYAGATAGRAIVNLAARTAIREGAEMATEAMVNAGYMTTARAVSLTLGATFAVGASCVIETPLTIREIYKLHRKKKFDKINNVTFKKECAKKISTRGAVVGGSAIGGTAGSVLGSFIPVPVIGTLIGTLVGTAAGSLVGFAIGNLVGRGIGSIFKDGMVPDFAIANTHLYTDYFE